jgi:hypothetical protein
MIHSPSSFDHSRCPSVSEIVSNFSIPEFFLLAMVLRQLGSGASETRANGTADGTRD